MCGPAYRGNRLRGETPTAVPNRGWITASIMLANIMQGVDNTIANVALPHIQGSLSASQDQIAWVLTSYIVAAAITMPLTGWLAGRLGIKYVFLFSVGGFTIASALCGSATSLEQLVLYRALQGVCGAGLIPLSQATLLRINPPERHGYAMAVGAMQLMLDRGELKDWFHSREIWVEATLAALSFYMFAVHTATASDRSFINRDLLKNVKFITGMVTAPRAFGTMIAMFAVARVINRIDNRLIILFGLVLTAFAMWQMTKFSLDMDPRPIVVSGFIQGFGLGCTFVPLNITALSTLPRHILTQGTAIRSLMRNLGGSVGISILVAALAENTQIIHSRLVETLRPDNPLLHSPVFGVPYSLSVPSGVAALNAVVTRQAAMIAYIDDFWLLMVVALASLPLLLLLRDSTPVKVAVGAPVAASAAAADD